MDEIRKEKLSEEDLKKVAGGYVFNASVLNPDDEAPWQVLDQNGKEVARWKDYYWALIMDKFEDYSPGGNPIELTWEQVQRLRETGSPD